MKFLYDPFVLRKYGEDRIFLVNAKMPFEYFVNCFFLEHPFFLVSVLDDGRIAITPNMLVYPLNLYQTGHWTVELFPENFEYVTIKNGTYPVIVTTQPVYKFEDWLKRFEKNVTTFAKETLAEFISTSSEFLPLEAAKPLIGRRLQEAGTR